MALVIGRTALSRVPGMNCWLGKRVNPLTASKMAAVAPIQIQVAGLMATYGDKYPYSKPWPNWENRKYTMFHEFVDKTSDRFNENSKIIIVEGNIGVGKNEFAKKLAAGFDLKYIPSPSDDNIFTTEHGFDIRQLDRMLPESAKAYDVTRFLSDPDPHSGVAGRLQIELYRQRLLSYAHGVHHLMSTGQGFVMVRSPFADYAMADLLRHFNYVTPKFMEYYYDTWSNSICDLLPPHISIYLDAPVSTLQQRIKERANPVEMNSKILTDQYLSKLESIYKQKVLKKLGIAGHVIEIDMTEKADDLEMDVIFTELELLDLEQDNKDDPRFAAWGVLSEDDYALIRRYMANKHQLNNLFQSHLQLYCPELRVKDEDVAIYYDVVMNHPAIVEPQGASARLGKPNWFGLW